MQNRNRRNQKRKQYLHLFEIFFFFSFSKNLTTFLKIIHKQIMSLFEEEYGRD